MTIPCKCEKCGKQDTQLITFGISIEQLMIFCPDCLEKYKQKYPKISKRVEYIAYLKGESWQELRRRVLERDNYLCQACLNKDAQDVHHITYANFGKEFCFELMSICRDCHNLLHEN